jgi:hypothetical protein
MGGEAANGEANVPGGEGASGEMSNRLGGNGTEESREEQKELKKEVELFAATGLPDDVLEDGSRSNRLARNAAWLAATACSFALLLTMLEGLSAWIRYPLAIVGAIPFAVIVALFLLFVVITSIRTLAFVARLFSQRQGR